MLGQLGRPSRRKTRQAQRAPTAGSEAVNRCAKVRTRRSRRLALRRIVRRMPRLQVYLPEDLYSAVKERRLPASELLQGAVRAELRRQELLEETDRYLSELAEEVGEPSPASVSRAERLARRVRGEKAGASRAS